MHCFDTSSCRIRISFASRPRRTRLCPSSAEEQSRQSRKQVRLWQSSSASAGWPRAGYRQLTAEISAATNVNIATAHGTCVTYGLLLWSLLDLQSRLELWEAAGPTELDGDEAPRLRRGHRPRQEKQSSFASASLSKATMRAFFVLHQVIEDNIGMVRIHRGNHLHSLNMGISSRSGGC